MTGAGNAPAQSAIRKVLAKLDLAEAQCQVREMPGAFSNFTHLLAVSTPGGETSKFVIRRYNPAKYAAGHDKQVCEYQALKLLRARNPCVPVPAPLLLDGDGSLLGLPGIVTEFLPGKAIALPAQARRWGQKAAEAARMLAQIHHTPITEADKRFLMNDDVEVAWFIKDGKLPDYMRADPDGEMVWQLVKAHWGRWKPVQPRFAHTDYWSGNILWQGDEISAVLDWEEAGYGHPAADVAYARMGYFIEGLPEAAELFLRVYEREAGLRLSDLALFELAASARPMMSPTDWFAHPCMEAAYRQFIKRAKESLLAQA